MSEQQDDQIIAIAFRKSIYVFLSLLAVSGGIWLFSQTTREDVSEFSPAQEILPKSIELKGQPEPPTIQFTDITQQAGISHKHTNGAYGERLLPETMGGGVAVLDFNNDQNVDLLFINGRSWPWHQESTAESSLILYQGDGSGNFRRLGADTFPESSIYGMGAAIGDFDNDGRLDIFVTAVGENRLYRNTGDGSFENVSSLAGVKGAPEEWSTGASFVDFDRDGDLDLFVLNYLTWSRDIDLQADYKLTGIGRAYGPPAQFAGTNSYLYRNDGDGTFSEVSEDFGIQIKNTTSGLPIGKGLGVFPTDIEGDGWVDLVVANDTVRNFLFRNLDGENFEEVGIERGVAFDNTGAATGAMGIDGVEFVDTDERAIAIGNFGNEMTSLYIQPEDQDIFTDQAIVTGVGPASRRAVTFGLVFLDYDLDGRKDLLQVNGHIEPEINLVEPGLSYEQSPQLFWNCGFECSRQFIPVTLASENDLSKPIVGRGAAYADIDQDGDQDLILTQIGGAPLLLRNDQSTSNNWIQVAVLNKVDSPALGAQVTLKVGEQIYLARVEPTRSYLSQVDSTLSFGLGRNSKIEWLKVIWPNGEEFELDKPRPNQRYIVRPKEVGLAGYDASKGKRPRVLER